MKYIKDINKFEDKRKKIEKLLLLSSFFVNKKIILTTLEEEASAAKLLIVSILKYSHSIEEIILTNDFEKNIKILKTILAKNWNIEKEIIELFDLIKLNKKHKKSPIEFMKNKKVIILDENQNIEIINSEKLKIFFTSIKNIRKIFQKKIRLSKF